MSSKSVTSVDITMVSKILPLFMGVFLLCGATKIPDQRLFLKENEAAISTDLFPTSSDEINDYLPSDAKFDIAKLVRELLEKLRGILEKLLDFAERQFSKALEKGNGVIRKIEEQTKLKIEAIQETVNKQIHEIIDKAAENNADVSFCVREIEEKFQTVLEQLLQELSAEIDNALAEETAKMRDSLDKIKKTINDVEVEPCAGSTLDEIKCWTEELARVTKALLYIPREVAKQTAQTVLDIGNISINIVTTASDTIEKAETIGKQIIDESKGCIPSAQ